MINIAGSKLPDVETERTNTMINQGSDP